MSVLTISSTNPNFSHILAKNPATIRESGKAYRREIRKGVCYGWFNSANDDSFRLWFKDHETQSSFAEGLSEEFEYLDRSRYGSPYIPIAMVTNCLASAAKEQSELDVPGLRTKTLHMSNDESITDYVAQVVFTIKVPTPRYLNQMAVHYADTAEISYELLDGRYYRLTIKAPTVYHVLNVMQVVCILQCLTDPETYVRMDTSAATKFVQVFNRANAPYFPRYLFQTKAMSNREMFTKLKDTLSGPGMDLTFGDTRQQRFDAIKQELTGGNILIDIGCGELFQAMRLAKNYQLVYAVDADEDRSENNRGKVEGRKIENIIPVHAGVNLDWIHDNADLIEDADILMTEVVEHIEWEAADELLTQMLLTNNPDKVVVTCPNKDFNKFYGLSGDEMRHHDHKFEPTFTEFCDWMVTIAAVGDYSVECKGIGDSVGGIHTSVMAVFTKKVGEGD